MIVGRVAVVEKGFGAIHSLGCIVCCSACDGSALLFGGAVRCVMGVLWSLVVFWGGDVSGGSGLDRMSVLGIYR